MMTMIIRSVEAGTRSFVFLFVFLSLSLCVCVSITGLVDKIQIEFNVNATSRYKIQIIVR